MLPWLLLLLSTTSTTSTSSTTTITTTHRDDIPAALFGEDGVEGSDVLIDLILVCGAN